MIAHRLFVLALVLTALACPLGARQANRPVKPDLEVFVHRGCPDCTAAKQIFEDRLNDQPST